ncbi:hypothetical protein [Bacillus sp. B-jedd]|uniref:hypothetical protein n=1 Tax=Bacillus sp. B-jedd TaxID=1476857 RepID=UPI0005155C5C|nr:hypothetical protein [Bacillus sp. B-jedd]CEG28784.1 group-specific protein [Bacillus sp. B-jedd]
MIKKLIASLIILLFITTNAAAQPTQQIEIFDIRKEKVVKTIESTPRVQWEVRKYLNGITSVFPKINPVPKEGFMIKVPLEPSVTVKTPLYEGPVSQTIIVFSGQENPYLLLFDEKNRLLAFNFKGNADNLLKLLKYNPRKEALEPSPASFLGA